MTPMRTGSGRGVSCAAVRARGPYGRMWWPPFWVDTEDFRAECVDFEDGEGGSDSNRRRKGVYSGAGLHHHMPLSDLATNRRLKAPHASQGLGMVRK